MELRNLAQAERYLEGFVNLERTHGFDYEKLGLARIRILLEKLGRPERKLECVHIAGSKGKGSVALAAETLLRAAGRRVGTYTSPHLVSWRERFRIDGAPVGEAPLVATLSRLQPVLERLRSDPQTCPSFFDVTTALAFLVFRDAAVDASVIEVGLGGRLDSTNVIDPRVSVLTSVHLEHTEQLGSSLEEIALEKAGILRPGVPLVHGPLAPEPAGVVLARAVALDAPVEEVRVSAVEQGAAELRVTLSDGRQLRAPVLGLHQATNLALAVRAVERFLGRELRPHELSSLEKLRLPGRVERRGDVIVDSAHTVESARALRETLAAVWPARRWVLVVSISRGKDAAGILAELAPQARAAVTTCAEPARSEAPDALEALAWAAGIGSVESRREPAEALARARSWRARGELLVATGSVYLAGAIRPLLDGALEVSEG